MELLAAKHVGGLKRGSRRSGAVVANLRRRESTMLRAVSYHRPIASCDVTITIDRGEYGRLDSKGRVVELKEPTPLLVPTRTGPTLRCIGPTTELERLLAGGMSETIGEFFEAAAGAEIMNDRIELYLGGDMSRVTSSADGANLLRNMSTMSSMLSDRSTELAH